MLENTLFLGGLLIWLILVLELFYCLKRFKRLAPLGEKARRSSFVSSILIQAVIVFNAIPTSLALFQIADVAIISVLLLISIILAIVSLLPVTVLMILRPLD